MRMHVSSDLPGPCLELEGLEVLLAFIGDGFLRCS